MLAADNTGGTDLEVGAVCGETGGSACKSGAFAVIDFVGEMRRLTCAQAFAYLLPSALAQASASLATSAAVRFVLVQCVLPVYFAEHTAKQARRNNVDRVR